MRRAALLLLSAGGLAALACTGAAAKADPWQKDAAAQRTDPPAAATSPDTDSDADADAGSGLQLADDTLPPAHGPEPTGAPRLLAELTGKSILHAGDSMVGGQAGLTRELEAKFKAAGIKTYKSDSWVSANLSMFHQQPHFGNLLKRHVPDLVIVTLGANDSFTAAPEFLVAHVKAIVARIGTTPCLWISPPPFTKPEFPRAAENFQKFVDMLEANVAPCHFFDTRTLQTSLPDGGTVTAIPRAKDKIHPTDKGGAIWAEAVWAAEFAP